MIHGGAFVMGSPDDYGPDFLFDQADFVMVPNTVQVHYFIYHNNNFCR